jgi:lipoprotein-anchoring transpeptidase ErfK/SrfK
MARRLQSNHRILPGVFAAFGPVVLAIALSPAGAMAQDSDELRTNLAWQLALERVHFSPGLIDGKIGPKTRLATREFQRVRGLPVTGELDEATAKALKVASASALTTYVIAAEDASDVGEVPESWAARAKLRRLRYESLADLVAERFHCTQGLLDTLNPNVDLTRLRPGVKLVVPNVAEPTVVPKAALLQIDLGEKVIRVQDRERRLVALLHCSIAKDKEKAPRGEARIVSITHEPAYSFDPAMWPEVKDVDRKLLIPPGPRNPVGLCWMGLSRPGYGIHGTPKPELIGKTGSHGCFRLTNWDALRLARMVREGTPVRFVEGAAAVASAE